MAMTARQRAKVSLYVQAGIFVVAVAAVILAVDWKTVGNSVFNFAKQRRPEHYGLILERTGVGAPLVRED